jgi:hypothetical protein
VTTKSILLRAVVAYVCIALITTLSYVSQGLVLFSETPLPALVGIAGAPLVVLASPFWYFQDAFQEPTLLRVAARVLQAVLVALLSVAVAFGIKRHSASD